MLINLSNHPSSGWSETQLKAAREWGRIVDISFPVIDPEDDSENIKQLAVDYLCKIDELFTGGG
jgi:hypothetical protein